MPLDISQIKLDAQLRLQLAEKAEELQRLVSKLYPGSTVLISDGPSSAVPATSKVPVSSDFKSLPFTQQIARVLRDAGKPMTKPVLHALLYERGSKVSSDTLMSYLSRGKGKQFNRTEDGLWSLRPALELEED
jgi:hypothetical protein